MWCWLPVMLCYYYWGKSELLINGSQVLTLTPSFSGQTCSYLMTISKHLTSTHVCDFHLTISPHRLTVGKPGHLGSLEHDLMTALKYALLSHARGSAVCKREIWQHVSSQYFFSLAGHSCPCVCVFKRGLFQFSEGSAWRKYHPSVSTLQSFSCKHYCAFSPSSRAGQTSGSC